MMKYPSFVYKCPGPHSCKGGSFDYKQVKNDEQLKDLLEKGWFPTLEIAINGNSEPDIAEILQEEEEG